MPRHLRNCTDARGELAAAFAAARFARRTPTNAEAALWAQLRKLRAEGGHFRREAPFRGYRLDFVCFRARLCIEVDGAVHDDPDQGAHDVVRDSVLAREGFHTERFTNVEVLDDLGMVMLTIRRLLKQRLLLPSPPGEGASP